MATITLKNVPDELYQRLKEEAARNRRSLNQEVITRLAGSAVAPGGSPRTETTLQLVRRLRPSLPPEKQATLDEIDRWKREGRE